MITLPACFPATAHLASSSERPEAPLPDSNEALSATSDRPDTQLTIREGIRTGRLRVRPMPGFPDRVLVVANPDGPNVPSGS